MNIAIHLSNHLMAEAVYQLLANYPFCSSTKPNLEPNLKGLEQMLPLVLGKVREQS